jgi:hypothetical protein
MAVDRLENGVAATEVRDVLREDVQVIGVRMQWGDTQLATLLSVVAVVIVGRDVRHVRVADDSRKTARERRLPGA